MQRLFSDLIMDDIPDVEEGSNSISRSDSITESNSPNSRSRSPSVGYQGATRKSPRFKKKIFPKKKIFSNTPKLKCCVCYQVIDDNNFVSLYSDGSSITQFGRTLKAVLQLTKSLVYGIRCCMSCCEETLKCFELLVKINVSTILTSRRKKWGTLSASLRQGCFLCPYVPTSVEDYSDHLQQHVFRGDLSRKPSENGKTDANKKKEVESQLCLVNDQLTVVEQKKRKSSSTPGDDFDINGTNGIKKRNTETEENKESLDPEYLCQICGKVIKYSLRNHMRKVHQAPMKETKKNRGPKQDGDKSEHDNDGGTFEDFLEDGGNGEDSKTKGQKKEPTTQCHLCGDMISSKGLKRHQEIKHGIKATASSVLGPCACHICGHVLSNTYSREGHMRRHAKDPLFPRRERGKGKKEEKGNYECAECGKKFTLIQLYYKHMAKNHRTVLDYLNVEGEDKMGLNPPVENPPDRSICNKGFGNSFYLAKHNKKHHLSYFKVDCPRCDTVCNDQDELQRHLYDKHSLPFPYLTDHGGHFTAPIPSYDETNSYQSAEECGRLTIYEQAYNKLSKHEPS